MQDGKAVATFKHHTGPVTTVEWHPTEPTVLASGGEDDQIALWDLSVERDEEVNQDDVEVTISKNDRYNGTTDVISHYFDKFWLVLHSASVVDLCTDSLT